MHPSTNQSTELAPAERALRSALVVLRTLWSRVSTGTTAVDAPAPGWISAEPVLQCSPEGIGAVLRAIWSECGADRLGSDMPNRATMGSILSPANVDRFGRGTVELVLGLEALLEHAEGRWSLDEDTIDEWSDTMGSLVGSMDFPLGIALAVHLIVEE